MHPHPTSDDINYIISDTGKSLFDGQEELLTPGTCHICKKSPEHSIVNRDDEDLVLLTGVSR